MSRRLEQSQAAFTRGIRDPAAQAAPAGLNKERYAVYRDLVYRNLDSLLTGGFPVLHATLPTDRWTALLREFLADHRAATPLFLQLGQEFLTFLGNRETQDWEPAWLYELAHYERVELELAIAPEDAPSPSVPGDLSGAVLRLSPVARLLCYEYPVHRIGPDHDPSPEATFLLVYRDENDEVQFMALQPATAQLLAFVEANQTQIGVALLESLADALGLAREQLMVHGLDQLADFVRRGVVYQA